VVTTKKITGQGAGSNVTQVGGGGSSTMFDFGMVDATKDVLPGFRLGPDHLHTSNGTGAVRPDYGVAGLISGAMSDNGGNAALHLSAQHDVTVSGIG
jgi:hypothetical protein